MSDRDTRCQACWDDIRCELQSGHGELHRAYDDEGQSAVVWVGESSEKPIRGRRTEPPNTDLPFGGAFSSE